MSNKLKLHRETVRTLTEQTLHLVVGGTDEASVIVCSDISECACPRRFYDGDTFRFSVCEC